MNLRVITPPTEEPVTLTEAKAYLRVDGTSDDTLITSLIVAAREKCEEISRRAFITQTLEETFDRWCLNLKLLRPPLVSVTSVKYTDFFTVQSTWTNYRVDTSSEPGVVQFYTVPGVALAPTGGIVIRYVAGYGAAANVPQRIKSAVLSVVMAWYESREIGNVPSSIRDALIADRVVWFA
jgi:uncharacterized phiE125 gp8 family phage protein